MAIDTTPSARASLGKTLEPVTLLVHFRLRPGTAEQFEAAMAVHLPRVAAEPTCERITFLRDADDPLHYMLFEDWADRGEFDSVQVHRAYRRPYLAATEPLWAEPRVTTYWTRQR